MRLIHLTVQQDYAVGSQPPEGYLAWHEWAEIQSKKGKLKQCECGKCGLWKFPQELSNETVATSAKDRFGRSVFIVSKICNKCAEDNLCQPSHSQPKK